jgi:plasmid replication initiation protein
MSKLLPERHPDQDFFVLDVLDVAPRSDMGSMEHPIFSLSPRPETRTLTYEHDDTKVEVIPSTRGPPTVFDRDILIYCISKLMHLKNSGKPIGPKVRLTTHDLLVSTNRPTNNLGYQRLEASLERLAGTVIKTTIETGDEATVSGFALISRFDYNRKGSMHAARLRYLEVTLSDWLFRAIESAEVLTISRDYFRLRSPLDRRLYELARKHCGAKERWRINIDKLQKKCGSRQERKHFMQHLRETSAADNLPEYRIEIQHDFAVFIKREVENAEGKPASPAPREAPAITLSSRTRDRPKGIFISTDAIERVRELVPGVDVYWLESAYRDFFSGKEPARNEDARFLKWAPSFMRQQKLH